MKLTDNMNDGFDIGGFEANRVCEFEVDIKIKKYDMSLKIKVNFTKEMSFAAEAGGLPQLYGCFSDGWTLFSPDFALRSQKVLIPG